MSLSNRLKNSILSALGSPETANELIIAVESGGGGGSGITALTGDVSATGPGSASATINTVGGSSSTNINKAIVQVLEGPSNLLYVNQHQPNNGTYTPDGSVLRPFIHIMDAVNQIITNNNGQFYIVLTGPGIYNETITLNNAAITNIAIVSYSATDGSMSNNALDITSITGDIISTANNDGLHSIIIKGFDILGNINLSGASTGTQFCQYGCVLSNNTIYSNNADAFAINLNNLGQFVMDGNGTAISSGSGGVTAQNVSFFGIYSTFLNLGAVSFITNGGANKPNGFSNTNVNCSFSNLLGTVSVGSGSSLVCRYSRLTGGTLTNSGTLTSLSSTFGSTVSNSGTWTSSSDSFLTLPTGTAPTTTGNSIDQSSGLKGSTSGIFTQKANASTTNYSVFWPAVQGSASTVLTNDGSGNLTWAASGGGGGGATTALDNLASTAVNDNILPDSNGTRNLGSGALRWGLIAGNTLQAYTQVLMSDVSSVAQIRLQGVLTLPGGESSTSISSDAFGTSTPSDSIALYTNTESTANAQQTGNIYIETGNKSAGTGNSGNIIIKVGSSAGGNRGTIQANTSIVPTSNFSYTLGTSILGWSNIFAQEVQTSNIQSPADLNISAGSSTNFVAISPGIFIAGPVAPTSSENNSTPYDVDPTADNVLFQNVGSASAINLPVGPNEGYTVIIKDTSGAAGAHHITINSGAGQTFESGGTTLVISTNFGAKTLVFHDTVWCILASV